MRRYSVCYTTTGFDECQKSGFDTFEDARAWARSHCSGWWTIANYYGEGRSINASGKPKETDKGEHHG